MERHFEEELRQLKEKLLRMSSLVESCVQKAVLAFRERNRKLAEEVVASDREIDMLEIEIENLAIRLLALLQPMAGDLRFIISVLMINNNLERLGDLGVNIAQRTIDLLKSPPTSEVDNINKMAELSQKMLKDSINAFVNNDTDLAQRVCLNDDAVDQLNRQIFKELLNKMQQDNSFVERSVDLILVSKNLEKVADHATNICEEVIYIIKGKIIKHHAEDNELEGHNT